MKGWLSAILFIGMLIGGYCWGSVGDTLGRRKTLIIAMAVNTVFGIGSSLSQGKATFFAMRFFSGLGLVFLQILKSYWSFLNSRSGSILFNQARNSEEEVLELSPNRLRCLSL